jgi:hypothetical protein
VVEHVNAVSQLVSRAGDFVLEAELGQARLALSTTILSTLFGRTADMLGGSVSTQP